MNKLNQIFKLIAFLLILMFTHQKLLAHHSAIAFDKTKSVTVTGKITRSVWRNPHMAINIDVADKDGNDIPIKDNIGKLYKVDVDKNISVVEEDLGIPNTFVWSPDNKYFYFTDTLNGTIISYNFELESGEISNKKELANFNRGHPDGSTIDTDGCVWNCRWGGSCIVRFTPTGQVDQIIEMPVQNITNCVFGGKDMKTLFITTASNKGENKNDLDGSLFAINLNYQGLEDNKSKLELS